MKDNEERLEQMKALHNIIKQGIQNHQLNQAQHLKMISKLKPQSQNCEDYVDMQRARDVLQGRILNIQQTVPEIESYFKMFQGLKAIADSKMTAQQIVCMDYCEDVDHKTLPECDQKCKLKPAQIKAYRMNHDSEDTRGYNCKPYSEELVIPQINIKNKILSIVKNEAPKIMALTQKALADYETQKKKYELQIKKIDQQMLAFPNKDCGKLAQAQIKVVQENVRRADAISNEGELSFGTLFYVESGASGVGIPVSAMHVTRLNGKSADLNDEFIVHEKPNQADRIMPGMESDEITENLKKKVEDGQVDIFKGRAGRHDRAHDITIGEPRQTSQKLLPVVASTEKPKVGQVFTLSGFPGNREGQFTQHQCRFKGYINLINLEKQRETKEASDSSQKGYLLYCPSVESIVSGMSGGPMTDAKGRAWGVLHAGDTIEKNMVFVSPLSKDPHGQLKMGIQSSPFVSDDCYRLVKNDFQRYRCQVFENSGDTSIP